jgi:hypothetical protein
MTVARNYLVVANKTLGGRHLIETVITRCQEGATVHVTVPATPLDAKEAAAGATAESVAQERLNEKLRRLEGAGVKATGNVGPADPIEAIREQLGKAQYTGVIISTLPQKVSRWLHVDLPHRVVREFGLPVEWVESRDDNDNPSIVHIAVPTRTAGHLSNQAGIPNVRTH